MSEEQTTQEKPTNPITNINDRDIPESINLIERAHIAAQRLEEANKRKEELIAREEAIEARRTLGGRTEAGGLSEKPLTEEEAYRMRAKARYAGTGLDPSK